MIERFHVENYKALRDVTLDLTPVHVLIGPNDTGKTSILEAIAALCRSTHEALGDAFTGQWKGSQLVWNGSPEAIIVLEASGERNKRHFFYQLACNFGRDGRRVRVARESVSLDGGQPVDFQTQNQTQTRVAQVSGGFADPIAHESCELVRAAIQRPQFYRFDSRSLALPVAPDSQRRFRLDTDGFGLALLLDDILGFDRNAFDALERGFRAVFPKIRSIKLIPERGYTSRPDENRVSLLQITEGKGLYFDMGLNDHLVPASQMSDGMLLVLAYLAILHSPEPPSILLIEEPENGIHPRRLSEVLKIIRGVIAAQGRTQVLLTTHSPYMVDLFAPEEVTLCQRGADGAVTVQRLSNSETVRKQMKIFTLGEIWTAEGDEALGQPAAPIQEPAS